MEPQLTLFGEEPMTTREKRIGDNNKREVWAELDKAKQCELVLTIAKRLVVATDNKVARILKIAPSTVSARRNDLFKESKAKWIVIPKLNKPLKVIDEVTLKKNATWRAVYN